MTPNVPSVGNNTTSESSDQNVPPPHAFIYVADPPDRRLPFRDISGAFSYPPSPLSPPSPPSSPVLQGWDDLSDWSDRFQIEENGVTGSSVTSGLTSVSASSSSDGLPDVVDRGVSDSLTIVDVRDCECSTDTEG